MKAKSELKELLTELEWRGILSDFANPENFLNLSDNQRILYLGIDCTADSLHIGHLLPFMQAVRLARIGFQAKILLGGATSKIGDPSDKLKERPLLGQDVLVANQRIIEGQFLKIFSRCNESFEGLKMLPLSTFFSNNKTLLVDIYRTLGFANFEETENAWYQYSSLIWPHAVWKDRFSIVNNRDWLDKLTFIDFIDSYGRNITINYLLSKETIRKRVSSEHGLSFSAFSYSLLQAYDFLHLYRSENCYGQIGSSDQWGNFTTGLKLINAFNPDNKCFAMTFHLILDDNGRKISKSDASSNIVWLSDTKTSFKKLLDYFSNMSDERAIDYAKKFTFITEQQLQTILKLNNPKSLRIVQRILAELFFFLVHGRDGLKWLGENATISQRQQGKL